MSSSSQAPLPSSSSSVSVACSQLRHLIDEAQSVIPQVQVYQVHARSPSLLSSPLPLPSELKKQVESAELKNQRLKEVFQSKIQEFRKACYTLTGYQVDVTTESQYRLSSMYAEHQADCLIFKVSQWGWPQGLQGSWACSAPLPS